MPEAFILHREIVLTMKASFTLGGDLTTEVARKSAMKKKSCLIQKKRHVDRRRSDDLPCGSVFYSAETAFFVFSGVIFVMYSSHDPDHVDFA